MSKAKSILCKKCSTIVGYTHKDNPSPTVYCPSCTKYFKLGDL